MNLPSLDFTNWRVHPTDNRFTIFFFKTKLESNYFEKQLKESSIWYEYNFDDTETHYQHYFAVNKTNEKEVIKLNHLTNGQFRKPFIQNNILRYSLVVLMVIVLAIGIIGYLKSH